jgi:hypothetical protein
VSRFHDQPHSWWVIEERIALRRRVAAEQNWRCAYCGVQMIDGGGRRSMLQCTLDEFIPLAAGGARTWANSVAACRFCNTARGLMEAFAFYDLVRQRGRMEAAQHALQWHRRLMNKHGSAWAGITARRVYRVYRASPNSADKFADQATEQAAKHAALTAFDHGARSFGDRVRIADEPCGPVKRGA